MEHEILEIWDFGKMFGSPFSNSGKKNRFWKCPPLAFQISAKNWVWQIEQLPKSKSPLSAIHKIIWHLWEDGSRKVNTNEPDLRIFHGNFWPVMSQAVRKPFFRPQSQGGKFLDFQTLSRLAPAATPAPPQIQIHAPPNSPRDEILPQGNPRCWHNTHHRWINSSGGLISVKSPHPAHKKSNGGPQMLARHQKSGFDLTWAHFEWTECVI